LILYFLNRFNPKSDVYYENMDAFNLTMLKKNKNGYVHHCAKILENNKELRGEGRT